MEVVDLCAGTGAFSLAFKKYGYKIVYANDYAKESKSIYELNLNHKLSNENIFNIEPKNIPKHKILTSGFPCQSFSLAGNREGFNDIRGNVFFKLLEIIDYHKPEILIFENVKGLVNHNKGNTFKTILDSLSSREYYLKWKVLNTSKLTGIPQNRERVYIIGFKNEVYCNKFTFDFPLIQKKLIKDFLETNPLEKYYYTDKLKVYPIVKQYVTKENTIYQYRRTIVRENKSGVCPTLTANAGTGGHNIPLLKDIKGIRKLTPRECFNLQGFPQNYIFPGDMSDSKLYKLAGNAVTLPIVEMIVNKIQKITR